MFSEPTWEAYERECEEDARERRWQAFREAHRAEIERVRRLGSFLDWRALGARLQAEFEAAERVLEELRDRSG